MNRHRLRSRGCTPGFTLIELVVIIIAMAIAATGVIALNAGIFSGQETNTKLQVGSALMQECGELILAKRNKDGFTSTTTANLTDFCITATGDTTMAATPAPVAGGTDPCPSGTSCSIVTITQGGLSPITLLLVQ